MVHPTVIMGSVCRARLLKFIWPQSFSSNPSKTIGNDELVPYELGWKWQSIIADQHINAQSSQVTSLILFKLLFYLWHFCFVFCEVQDRRFVGTILMLQHSSVYTLGTGTTANSGPFIPSRDSTAINIAYRDLDYSTVKVDRAGQATYHGPGQVVLYPILDLVRAYKQKNKIKVLNNILICRLRTQNFFEKDINTYLRNLEQVVINCLSKFGIQGERVEGYTGVWVGRYKVAAIGVKIRRCVLICR